MSTAQATRSGEPGRLTRIARKVAGSAASGAGGRVEAPGPCAVALILSLVAASVLACGSAVSEAPERIVLIVVDTLRADHVGAYGGAPRTPHMDRLAGEGRLFTRALASYHQTSMSMAALFTGRVPSLERGGDGDSLPWTSETYCGMARFRTPEDGACVPRSLDTLAESLSGAGYATLGVVGNPLLFDPYGYSQGFDDWVEVGPIPGGLFRTGSQKAHAERRTGDRVNARVREVVARRSGDRFFLYVHYLDVHDWLLVGRSYRAAVEAFDRQLGELLDLLGAERLLEDAVVILTADHGELLDEQHPLPSRGMHFGNPSYEPVLRVPLIVWPTARTGGDAFGHEGETIRSQDLRGAIARLGGVEPKAAPPDGAELFLSEKDFQTLHDGRWKSVWPRTGGAPMLFDLDADPAETRNRARSRADVLAAHRDRIDGLAKALAVDGPAHRTELDPDEASRLRALGYLDEQP